MNKGLAQLNTWNKTEIEHRTARLAVEATKIWVQPKVRDEVLAAYQTQFAVTTGFDWSTMHEILEKIPAGRWTGYYYLAEAAGTSAQAVASHISKCQVCAAPYRVLTWDGRIAEGFAWMDPNDDRDPRVVLEAEGVVFTGGVADAELKLAAEGLLALMEEV